jgi:hypothetical protein
MKKETFGWMVLTSKKMIDQWPLTVATNLNLIQNFHTNRLGSSGSEAIGPHHCDEEMRERYRI